MTTAAAPRVSVVVPIFNGEKTIGALLHALAGQKPLDAEADQTPRSHEILIVDNASTDGTRAVLESAGIANLRVLDEPKRGPSAARNRGLRESHAEIVAFLDADCVPTRPWLREIVAPFADARVVLVAGGLASYPPKTAAQRFAARYGLNEARRSVEMNRMPFANTRNMAIRRDAALAVGGLPEDLTAGEDVEFSYLVRQRFDCPITYQPQALAFHQDREDDESLRLQAMSYGRSMAILYERHPDLLSWGTAQRLRRSRTKGRRRASAAMRGLALRVGLGEPSTAEFAHYLALWTSWFWRGFDDGRASGRPAQ